MPSFLTLNILRSLMLALGASIAVYALAWGLFTTHQELEVSGRAAFSLAAWTFPIVFVGSLIVYAAKGAGSRRQ